MIYSASDRLEWRMEVFSVKKNYTLYCIVNTYYIQIVLREV